MSVCVATDPVLVRFRAALDALYGPRLDRVVLFGSRARGDAGADSDYDVAVFLQGPVELWEELGRLSRVTTGILDDTSALISAKPFLARLYDGRTPLMHEIRRDGVAL